jgi:hypothetical protein
MTEMRFRGLFFRLCELLYAGWQIFIRQREPILTVGKCQVSFFYWRQHFKRDSIKLLCSLHNDLENYAVCCQYLRDHEWSSISELLTLYNGRPSYLYAILFHKNLDKVISANRLLKKRQLLP